MLYRGGGETILVLNTNYLPEIEKLLYELNIKSVVYSYEYLLEKL
jgi:hypothetical protein